MATTSEYYDKNNYELKKISDNSDVAVISVLPVSTSTSTVVDLEIGPFTRDAWHRADINSSVKDYQGNAIGVIQMFRWWAHRTKPDSAMDSMPPVYKRAIGSNMRSMLEAIAQEDERIGGSY